MDRIKAENKRTWTTPGFWIRIVCFSLVFAFAAQSYWLTGRSLIQTNEIASLIHIFSFHPRPFFCAFGFGLIATPVVVLFQKQIAAALYKYRYLLGLLLLGLCVTFKISGSSISIWHNYIPQSDGASIDPLFGMIRPIRSDEWAVNTPFAFSQYQNVSGAFSYFSDTIRGTSTDTFIVYGQPVWNIAVLFRPFHWGYLFLSQERGLSFFWCARLIALTLVSFDMGMLIGKKNKLLSIAMTALVAFAPTVQWWFAINGLVEMLVFGQMAILLVHRYMTDEKFLHRLLCVLALVICGGGFILTFYPAWEVVCAYIFLALLIWVIWENAKTFSFCARRDIPLILLFFLLLGSGMLYIISQSSETITTVMNTVYPGSRAETGGGCLRNLFYYIGNPVFPFSNLDIPSNTCEMSAFYSFAPMGLILAVMVLFKKRDRLLICLLGCEAFLLSYIIFGFPELLAKLTLLSNCPANRVCQIIGFLEILILIRAVALFDYQIKPLLAAILGSLLAVGATAIAYRSYGNYLGVYKSFIFTSLGVFAAVMFSLLLLAQRQVIKRIFSVVTALMLFLTGMLVNPVQVGAEAVLTSPLYQAISEIRAEDSGKWIVGDVPQWVVINLPIMAGAPTINSTNVYPAMERWETLDPEGLYSEVYNRYAHMLVDIQNDAPTWFELYGPDAPIAHIYIEDLKTLEVSYILSPAGAMDSFEQNSVVFEEIRRIEPYSIYKISYIG
jgi:hypothetical protein